MEAADASDMADIFISYSRSDKHRVAPLVAAIEAQGWSVWWDPGIAPGQEFDQCIAAELAVAAAVLVVWTPASVQSRWVRGEARDGADRGILVPVRFDGAVLPIDFRAIHTTDLDRWRGNTGSPEIQDILRALGAVISRGASPRTVATGSPPESAAALETGRIAICVLPFANMSGDPEQDYFSDGITEDITTDLSKVSVLSVIARNSAFMYKGRNVDVQKVARELDVSHVLEGSVRKSGGRVRITAQLVKGSSNDHVWAERYDRDLNDIFALQDEISEAIVKALKLTLLPEEKRAIEQRGTDSVEAYNLYLMARQYRVSASDWASRPAEATVRLCTHATEIDPNYARAWSLLANGLATLRFGLGRPGDDGLAAAERALALDPGLAEAHAVKAKILTEHGHTEEASQEIDVALRLAPESYEVNRSAGKLRYRQHRLEDAILHYGKAMTLLDTDVHAAGMLVSCYMAIGDEGAARRTAQTAIARAEKAIAADQNDAGALSGGAYSLAMLGEAERAKAWMNRATLIDPDNVNARYNFVCSLVAHLHDVDGALSMLESLLPQMSSSFVKYAMVDPDLAPLHEVPRFQAMIADAEARFAAAQKP
ncbi:MAG: TIR domain-containing protein [Steroidobacteraceae bacterium]|nr:TIR domain-containing protein [Steroidobacteraceae bacterium]